MGDKSEKDIPQLENQAEDSELRHKVSKWRYPRPPLAVRIDQEVDAVGGTGNIEALGDLPPAVAEWERRSKAAKAAAGRNRAYDPNFDPYGYLIMTTQVAAALVENEEIREAQRTARKKAQKEFQERVYGVGNYRDIDIWINPSLDCARQAAYDWLVAKGILAIEPNSEVIDDEEEIEEENEQKTVPEEKKEKLSPHQKKLKGIFAKRIGTTIHKELEEALRLLGWDVEVPFEIPEYYMRGKIDAIRRDPDTGEIIIVDHKIVGQHTFKKVNRDKWDTWLRRVTRVFPSSTKMNYRRQVMFYMWVAANGYIPGYDKTDNIVGVLHYINRDNPIEEKYAIVEWDPETQFDAQKGIEFREQAGDLIEEGKLPEPDNTSTETCRYCPWNKECTYAAIRPSRGPLPKYVQIMQTQAKRERLERARSGIVLPQQQSLFVDETSTRINPDIFGEQED